MKHFQTSIILFTSSIVAQSATVGLSESTAVASGQFVDGNNFFGLVSGGQISGLPFVSSLPTTPENSITGRDHDHGGRPELVTASWSIGLPANATPGTGLTNISFSGMVAASQIWDNTLGDNDFIDFELLLNGAIVSTLSYRPNNAIGLTNAPLALDRNNDGVGDGSIISTSGITFNLSDSGGATITSAVLRGTYRTDSGNEEHWTTGTLTADFDQIPEPSSSLLLGLTASFGLVRRRRSR